jgi:hypothetical protein
MQVLLFWVFQTGIHRKRNNGRRAFSTAMSSFSFLQKKMHPTSTAVDAIIIHVAMDAIVRNICYFFCSSFLCTAGTYTFLCTKPWLSLEVIPTIAALTYPFIFPLLLLFDHFIFSLQ